MRQDTTQQLLREVYKRIDELDAEVLLAHVLKCSREYLLSHSDHPAPSTRARRFRRLVAKRAQGMPLAYLTGHKEFFGLSFIVNKDVLIPRPETETIVELALNRLQQLDLSNQPKIEDRRPKTILIDVGTGSGCIPISITKALKKIPPLLGEGEGGITFIATDISSRALLVAKKNAARYSVNITFLRGNLLEPVIKKYYSLFHAPCFLIITANLPYLTAAQYQSEPSIQHEPKCALMAGKHGLALYAELLKQIKSFISSFSRLGRDPARWRWPHFHISCFFEIDPSQSKPIVALIRQHLPQAKVEIKPDLAWRERVMIIEMTKNQDGICLCL